MELKIEEIQNSNTKTNIPGLNSDNDVNQIKYWEQPKITKTKKKVTFDDILTNMNLVVSENGVLQYMRPSTQGFEENQSLHHSPQINNYKEEPINPAVKHSPIYNKYFKDYREMNDPGPTRRQPKSIQELKQMLREDKIKEIQHKLRVAQMKPKHMFFTSAMGSHSSTNHLRSMSFK